MSSSQIILCEHEVQESEKRITETNTLASETEFLAKSKRKSIVRKKSITIYTLPTFINIFFLFTRNKIEHESEWD